MAQRRRNNLENLREAKRLYFRHPDGLKDEEIAALLDVTRPTAYRYRLLLDAIHVDDSRYTCEPDAKDIEFAEAILWRAKRATK